LILLFWFEEIQAHVSNRVTTTLSFPQLLLVVTQPIGPFSHCDTAMTHDTFFFRRHGREGLVLTVWNKDTVPSKALHMRKKAIRKCVSAKM